MRRYALRDDQWERIKDLLPGRPGHVGVTAKDNRLFVEGVDEYTTKDGVVVAVPYAGVIEFRGDKISGWRDYVDRGVIDAQKAGGGLSPQVKELVGRPAQS